MDQRLARDPAEWSHVLADRRSPGNPRLAFGRHSLARLACVVRSQTPLLPIALEGSHFPDPPSGFFSAAWRHWLRLSPSKGLVR